MGDPALADPALMEDFHRMDDPAWHFGGDKLLLEGAWSGPAAGIDALGRRIDTKSTHDHGVG